MRDTMRAVWFVAWHCAVVLSVVWIAVCAMSSSGPVLKVEAEAPAGALEIIEPAGRWVEVDGGWYDVEWEITREDDDHLLISEGVEGGEGGEGILLNELLTQIAVIQEIYQAQHRLVENTINAVEEVRALGQEVVDIVSQWILWRSEYESDKD